MVQHFARPGDTFNPDPVQTHVADPRAPVYRSACALDLGRLAEVAAGVLTLSDLAAGPVCWVIAKQLSATGGASGVASRSGGPARAP